MNAKLGSRRLQFSIRTLLVTVTMVCVWLSLQVSIVSERKEVVKLLDHRAGAVSFSMYADPPNLNVVRRMLDDVPPLYSLHLHDPTHDEIQRVRIAFREIVDFQVFQTQTGR